MGAKFSSALLLGLCAAFLSLAGGCGAYNPGSGGTGGGGGGTYKGQAQGFYSCLLQDGLTMQALILPTDQFFGVFGTPAVNSFSVTRVASGQGTSGNQTYSGTFTGFSSGSSLSSFTDILAATDVPQTSMSGTITEGGVKIGFGGSALATSFYDFTTAASQSAIAGAWPGSLLDGSSVTLNISSTGAVSTTGTGCQVSGTIAADSKNNFYSVKLVFGSSPCSVTLAGQTTNGAGIYYLLPDQVTHQLLLPVASGSTVGTVFFAHR